ncbi:MAG: S-adenosylmethionine hydrolase [Halobacteriales archaeon]|jgi:S-adenosylmethionine hydrolase
MITLSSDFGTPYPAAMKGVILDRCDARLVDVAHDFPRQDVRAAAFWLREVLPHFPPGVHLVVVDPGVGTDRAALVVRAGDHVLVGPDNGVLVPVARELAISGTGQEEEANVECFEVAVEDPASSTFHGRDVFAPIAAAVHEESFEAFVEIPDVSQASDPEVLALPSADVEGDLALGEVLVVDGFGNVITNVPGRFLAGADSVAADERVVPAVETFAAVEPGERLATVGSHGNVELDVNRGRGDEAFDLRPGDDVRLERR